LVFPHNCLICKKHNPTRNLTEELCLQCLNSIDRNRPPFCPKCSRHLGAYSTQTKCRECKKIAHHFDFAWSACLYTPTIKKLIHLFKYSQKTQLAKTFSLLMTDFIVQHNLDITQFDEIVPVPLFPSRLRERGYNQSELLAYQIAKKYGIDLSLKRLLRVRNTGYQAQLSEKNRWTNIRGAFRIKQPFELQDKSILVVDDLLTTGATASEAAITLKESGAKTVGVLTLAIALQPHH